MNILTENELRGEHLSSDCTEYKVSADTYVTPLAEEYLRDRKIVLRIDNGKHQDTMTVDPIRDRGNKTYIDAYTGRGYKEKPEEMTHLRGNLLVGKDDPRIAFRGKIDTLEAQIVLTQILAERMKYDSLSRKIGETLLYVRRVLSSEVKEEPLAEQTLFGLDSEALRYDSQHVDERFHIPHIVPDSSMGELAAALNLLRCEARECELTAVKAFGRNGITKRPDIIKALNRLSSAYYILTLRLKAGMEDKNG